MILDSIIIYNPKFKPKVKKAYEEDIQDAKLLYYYSVRQDVKQGTKRNHVGLSEGLVMFIRS